eukprot:403368312
MFQRIRIHIYFDQICKSEVLDLNIPFEQNFARVLLNLGIPSNNHYKYVMKLTNGGVVERNEVLFHDDRVIILMKEDIIPIISQQAQQQLNNSNSQQVKLEGVSQSTSCQENQPPQLQPQSNAKVKQEANQAQALLDAINSLHMKDFHQIFKTYRDQHQEKFNGFKNESNQTTAGKIKSEKSKKSKHSAFINSDSSDLKHERIQYKTLLKKRIKKDEDGDDNQIKIEERLDECNGGRMWSDCNIVRKIDYDNLEVLLYKNQISDYHQLIDAINMWAVGLGFLVKLKRSPKLNADGSQTLRLYCQSFKRSEPLDTIDALLYKENPQCHFALTFKQDDKTGCWLMYQEYVEEFMKHNHKLEKRRYDSIREYVKEYHDKVKTLSELKELIYDKFGLEYTLNQITYFKGKYIGEAIAVEKDHGENEALTLLRLLKKGNDDYIDVEFDPNDKSNLLYLFYSSAKMKDAYLKSSDVVFVNKRFSQNRFKKPMVMLFTVSNTGKSVLLGFALIEKEETFYFAKIAQGFLKQMGNKHPQTLIIERQLKLHQAFREQMPQTNILFCYFHIQRTFKQQYSFLERENLDQYQKIVELPIIENEQAFDMQLAEVNQYSFANEYFKLIIQKLTMEKKLWPKWCHMKYFTGGVSVCQRNEQIKTYLKPALKKRDCTVSETLKRLLTIDQKEFKLSHEFQKVSPKHEQVFKVANFLNHVVKESYTLYAYQRMKWNIARGFRFEIKEETHSTFVLQLKQSNIANKKPWQPTMIIVQKELDELNQKIGICECLEFNHSGFPCPHLCLLNYKGKLITMQINNRWLKSCKDRQIKNGERSRHQRKTYGALDDIESQVISISCETQTQKLMNETQSVFNQNLITQISLDNYNPQKVTQQQDLDEDDDQEDSQLQSMSRQPIQDQIYDPTGSLLDVSQFLRNPTKELQNKRQVSEEDISQDDRIPIKRRFNNQKLEQQDHRNSQSQMLQSISYKLNLEKEKQIQLENEESDADTDEDDHGGQQNNQIDQAEVDSLEDENDEESEDEKEASQTQQQSSTRNFNGKLKSFIFNKNKRTVKASEKYLKNLYRIRAIRS